MENKIKIHIWISIILFFLVVILRIFLNEIKLPYGHGDMTIGSILFVIYGIYLIFVSCKYFNYIVEDFKKTGLWVKNIFKGYLLLILYYFLMNFVGVIGYIVYKNYSDLEPYITNLFMNETVLAFVAPTIVFPVSIFTIALAIKSLIIASKEDKSYWFGIIFLIISLALLALSFPAFWLNLLVWIAGGFRM